MVVLANKRLDNTKFGSASDSELRNVAGTENYEIDMGLGHDTGCFD